MESAVRRHRAVSVEDPVEAGEPVSLPYTFGLEFPIQLRTTDGLPVGDVMTQIVIERRPTAGDLVAADGLGEIGTILKIVERICGLTPVHAKMIDVRDFGRIAKIVGTFLV